MKWSVLGLALALSSRTEVAPTAAVPCPVPPTLNVSQSGATTPTSQTSPYALAALRAKIADQLQHAGPECRPGLELAAGEIDIAMGHPELAEAALARATVGLGDNRGRAFFALGRAQASLGQPFEALRSLAMAQRLLPVSDPLRAATIADATLLARVHLRRGGTVWGAWVYDSSYERPLKDLKVAPGAIACTGSSVWVAGKRGAARIDGVGSSPVPAGTRVAGIASNTAGLLAFLLEEGSVVRGDGLRFELRISGDKQPLKATAIAIANDNEIAVVVDGRLEVFDARGEHARTFEVAGDAHDVAADGRGQWHVLLAGDGGIVRLTRNRESAGSIPPIGDGWSLQAASAIAADRFGTSYVLIRSTGTVLLFDSGGKYAGHFEPPAADRSLLRNARALSVDHEGHVYLLADQRVVRYR